MGANFSSCVSDGDSTSLRPRLGDIPESVVALVLMYLDPPDICKLARLNRAFRHASFADFVWESKLPLNYKFLIEKALEDNKDASFVEELGKKRDIYATLCRSNLFDNGTKVLEGIEEGRIDHKAQHEQRQDLLAFGRRGTQEE